MSESDSKELTELFQQLTDDLLQRFEQLDQRMERHQNLTAELVEMVKDQVNQYNEIQQDIRDIRKITRPS